MITKNTYIEGYLYSLFGNIESVMYIIDEYNENINKIRYGFMLNVNSSDSHEMAGAMMDAIKGIQKGETRPCLIESDEELGL